MKSTHNTTVVVPRTLRAQLRAIGEMIDEASKELQDQPENIALQKEVSLDRLSAELYQVATDIIALKSHTRDSLLAKADVVLIYADVHGDTGDRAASDLAHAILKYFDHGGGLPR